MFESGYLSQLLKRYDVISACDIIKDAGAVAVTANDLIGIFSVLVIGFGLGTACIIIEKRLKRQF